MAEEGVSGQEVQMPRRRQADQGGIEEALVIGDEQDRAAPGNVALAFDAQAETDGQGDGAEPVDGFIPEVGQPVWHRRTSFSMRSTTSSRVRWVVSRRMASGAGTIGAKSRSVSRWSRTTWARRTSSRATVS